MATSEDIHMAVDTRSTNRRQADRCSARLWSDEGSDCPNNVFRLGGMVVVEHSGDPRRRPGAPGRHDTTGGHDLAGSRMPNRTACHVAFRRGQVG